MQLYTRKSGSLAYAHMQVIILPSIHQFSSVYGQSEPVAGTNSLKILRLRLSYLSLISIIIVKINVNISNEKKSKFIRS